MIRHQFNCPLSRHSITWVKHYTPWNWSEHWKVLQPHLRWSILSNWHSSMWSNILYFSSTHSSHSDLIVCSWEKCRESRCKCHLSSTSQSLCPANHVLFCDEAFHEICGNGIFVCLSKSGVFRVSVHSHDLVVHIVLAQGNQGLPVCFPCWLLPIGCVCGSQGEGVSFWPFSRFRHFWCEIKLESLWFLERFQMFDCACRHWFAVPIQLVLNLLDILPLEGLGQYNLWLILGVSALFFSISKDYLLHGLCQGSDIVSINLDDAPSKGLKSLFVHFNVMSKGCLLRLTQSIDVEDGSEIIQLVVTRKMGSLPNGALCTLPIAHNDPISVVYLVEIFWRIGHAPSNRKPLP